MDNWVLLGLLAAISYAISAVASKVSLDKRYAGLDATSVALLAAVGVAMGFSLFYLAYAGVKVPKITGYSAALGVSVGLFWALGSIFVYLALLKGADISRMAPIYNLNTLFVVVLGIMLLGELPEKAQAIRVAAGAVLITAGAILVSV
jgi:uncharacterized membrane protein